MEKIRELFERIIKEFNHHRRSDGTYDSNEIFIKLKLEDLIMIKNLIEIFEKLKTL